MLNDNEARARLKDLVNKYVTEKSEQIQLLRTIEALFRFGWKATLSADGCHGAPHAQGQVLQERISA